MSLITSMRTLSRKTSPFFARHIKRAFGVQSIGPESSFFSNLLTEHFLNPEAALQPPSAVRIPSRISPGLRKQSLVLGSKGIRFEEAYETLAQDILKDKETGKKGMGALILGDTKEQCTRIYKRLKNLDTKGSLEICRLGSITYRTPQLLLQEKYYEIPKSELELATLQNLLDVGERDGVDILIVTPSQLWAFARDSPVFKAHRLVLQDFELMFQDQKKALCSMLENIHPSSPQLWISRDQNPIVELSLLQQWLPSMQQMALPGGQNRIERDHPVIMHSVKSSHKIPLALQIINDHREQNGIIICKSAEEARQVRISLKRHWISTYLLLEETQFPPAIWNILCFKQAAGSVLVCEEGAVRSANLEEADFAIWLHKPASETDLYYRLRAVKPEARIHKLLEEQI